MLFYGNLSFKENEGSVPVDTRRRFNVYKTPMRCQRRRVDVS